MKKLVAITFTFPGVIIICSCEYDDSNDLDILRPNDSTQTGLANTEGLQN
ncbi:hypothetical protein NYZ99_03995 [Maribacter litopenaei]|uniref:Uncharacterized protein n=1 Tax=Maribacter litopenaei TaxID=2976127 RepID=A0ABY5YBP6_9FLAO|nr:hypothetical protein [Maribacter litopenaei]UWX55634.1 hypothetical protein NYZ99_03995 [Maribacter litopenaei]